MPRDSDRHRQQALRQVYNLFLLLFGNYVFFKIEKCVFVKEADRFKFFHIGNKYCTGYPINFFKPFWKICILIFSFVEIMKISFAHHIFLKSGALFLCFADVHRLEILKQVQLPGSRLFLFFQAEYQLCFHQK